MLQRTVQIRIKDKILQKELKDKLDNTRKFHNQTLYFLRKKFFYFWGKEVKDFEGLEKWIKDSSKNVGNFASWWNVFMKTVMKISETNISCREAQQVCKQIASSWKSFFSLKWARIPWYSDKVVAQFHKWMVSGKSLKERKIQLMWTTVWIKTNIPADKIQAYRVKERNGYIYLEIVYYKEKKEKKKGKWVVWVDLWLNNLLTVAFLEKKKPLIFSGRKIKSINQGFNKWKISSEKRYQQLQNEIGRITNEFMRKIDDVGTVIIGKWWEKQKINLWKRNNQNFVFVPYNKIIKSIQDKCEEKGIKCVVIEESYTSKSSFFDWDNLPTYGEWVTHTFSWKRIKRWLYKCANGMMVNADVNGAFNIMKKIINEVKNPFNSMFVDAYKVF